MEKGKIAQYINVNSFVYNIETSNYEVVTLEILNYIHSQENSDKDHEYMNYSLNMFWIEKVFGFRPLSKTSPNVLTHHEYPLKIWRRGNMFEFNTNNKGSGLTLTTINELLQYLNIYTKNELLIDEDTLAKLNVAHKRYITDHKNKIQSERNRSKMFD